MTRLTRTRPEDLTADQRDAVEQLRQRIGGGRSDGYLGGPFDAWVLNPDLQRGASALGLFFETRTTISRRLVKLVILTVAARYRSNFPFAAHRGYAVELGIPDPVIDALHRGESPPFDDDDDRAAHAIAIELLDTGDLTDTSYQSAVDTFGEVGVAELVNLTGFYVMVAFTNNAFRSDVPESVDTIPFPVN